MWSLSPCWDGQICKLKNLPPPTHNIMAMKLNLSYKVVNVFIIAYWAWKQSKLIIISNNIAVSSCKLVLEPFITPFPLKELVFRWRYRRTLTTWFLLCINIILKVLCFKGLPYLFLLVLAKSMKLLGEIIEHSHFF